MKLSPDVKSRNPKCDVKKKKGNKVYVDLDVDDASKITPEEIKSLLNKANKKPSGKGPYFENFDVKGK